MLCASCAGLLDAQVVIDGCDDVGTLTSSGALALALSAGQGHVDFEAAVLRAGCGCHAVEGRCVLAVLGAVGRAALW